jgi:RNA-directed DNA polymerase
MARTNRDRAFSSLHHVIDMEWMQEAYGQTREDGAPGIDGVTAQAYEANLEVNLHVLAETRPDRWCLVERSGFGVRCC